MSVQIVDLCLKTRCAIMLHNCNYLCANTLTIKMAYFYSFLFCDAFFFV
ncbi:hypothetical protein SAMN05216354_0847 [Xylanibacter ruminicola]|uniref:Uncharacterized protein n=1 Tax=Xylanibacter ruminicola TaxID=839 RepID=A0A1H5T3L0_XYLRU|nr:hypothetical protein SAMN05216354_0847 [Xylanibacter ruminicola]